MSDSQFGWCEIAEGKKVTTRTLKTTGIRHPFEDSVCGPPAKAEEMFHVGNLYLNRKCTGVIGRCAAANTSSGLIIVAFPHGSKREANRFLGNWA